MTTDSTKQASEAWQDVKPWGIEIDDYVGTVYDAEDVERARAADAQQIALLWKNRSIDAKRIIAAEELATGWRNAALRVGEELAKDGPDGYYAMPPDEWRAWAIEQAQQIAALRAENARLFNLLDFKDPDIDPAATMTPDEMHELQASFDAFVAARQERAAKLADYDRLKEQLTALQAEQEK